MASNEADAFACKALRTVREANGESQEKLAPVLGVTFQQVQKYEKGVNRLTAGKIKKAADHYNVSPLVFFDGEFLESYAEGKHAVRQVDMVKAVLEFKGK